MVQALSDGGKRCQWDVSAGRGSRRGRVIRPASAGPLLPKTPSDRRETKVVSRTAGGAYTLKGDRYEETPQYGFGEDFNAIRDIPQPFTLRIEGDRWHLSGTLSNGLKIEEVWERSKKP
jgi:hypothetical protein